MKKFLLAGACALAVSSVASAEGMNGAINFGMVMPMSGDSFLSEDDFKDQFDLGWTLGANIGGGFSDYFGWRAEVGYDRMPADGDALADVGLDIEGDLTMLRYMGGIQISPFNTESNGLPYAYVTVGGVNADFEISGSDGDVEFEVDADLDNAFGMSFGGGYNYFFNDSMGVGADLRVTSGFFEDNTLWWWNVGANLAFRF